MQVAFYILLLEKIEPLRYLLLIILVFCTALGCRQERTATTVPEKKVDPGIMDARGFSVAVYENGVNLIRVYAPWPGAEKEYRYLLIPHGLEMVETAKFKPDAIIRTPVDKVVVTSTTHIAALEALGVEHTLVGFPGTAYISLPNTRKRIDAGEVVELGANELINTERLLALHPDVVIGFSIDNQNQGYETISNAGIPVVYNGDWTEATPLGKAEWLRFFGPFFGLENKADSIYTAIKTEYRSAMKLAANANTRPTVLSGALYKDVWYLPGGDSWAAAFISDANARYLWADSPGNGSLSLGLETVLETALEADFWISPSQFTTYQAMREAENHYEKFKAFKHKKIYTYAATTGATGGLLYFELGPQRPDLILKDLIAIFHPEILPEHIPYFFKPLQ